MTCNIVCELEIGLYADVLIWCGVWMSVLDQLFEVLT